MARFTGALRDAWRTRNHHVLPNAVKRKDAWAGPEMLFLRARAMARSGAVDMAVRLYADAAALDPSFVEAIEARGELLDVMGQRTLAMEMYATARKLRAGIRLGAPDRHFVLRQRGNFIHEITAYDSVLRSIKKNSLPYVARGNAYLAAGHPEKALVDYDRALRLKRKQLDIIALKGEALSMLGRFDEALEAFDHCLSSQDKNPEMLSGRAIARMALGRIEQANADWRQQFGLLADRPAACACVALRLADYGAALPLLEAVLATDPADSYWRLYRLTAQYRLRPRTGSVEGLASAEWPGPLIDLHAGRVGEDEVLRKADTPGRRVEALFQLGVLAFDEDRSKAERYWNEVLEIAPVSLIEFAAARNELSRLSAQRA